MSGLLPTRTDETIDRNDEASMLYVDDERTEEILSTLSSETTREVFCALNDEPMTVSEIADRLNLSLQNASYHLNKLHEADLVEIIDTCYSEKGRQMDVYAALSEWTVLILGTRSDGRSLRQAFERMAGTLGAPAVLVALWAVLVNVLEDVSSG